MLISAADLVPIERDATPLLRESRRHIVATIGVEIGGRPCAVHFDDRDVAAIFHARYADLTVTAERYAHESFAMTDPQLGPLFWTIGGPAYRWPHGPLPPHVQAFLADGVALAAFFNLRTDGLLSMHAATVGVAGAAAAIVGNTNAGKTTTAIACARAGLRLYGDERCVVDRAGHVSAFPRALNVRAPGRELLLRDRVDGDDPVGARLRARPAGDWNDVRLGELLGNWNSPPPAPLRAVFILDGTGRQPRLKGASAVDAAKAAARWTQGAGHGLDKLARLLELFDRAWCYRLTLGSPHASARAIEGALRDVALLRPVA